MKIYSKGLKYKFINARCYEVKGKGLCFGSNIVIPEYHKKQRVTTIGVAAFENNKSLESIVIPEGVTSIGKDAFKGCLSLVSVTLPSTLESIAGGAFLGCVELTEIVIPEKIKHIGEYVFADCKKLKRINLSNVATIDRRAFGNCVSLDDIDLSATTEIADEAFINCESIRNAQAPEESGKISVCAFEKCRKRQLGSLWVGNKYIDKLTSAAFKDDDEFQNGVYELFYNLTQNEDPNEIREMFRIYREVLNNVAGVGLANAHCITYLSDEDRAQLAKVLFEDGYGKALHKLMHHASRLYSYMATRVTPVSAGTIDRLIRRMENEPNRLKQANYTQEKAEIFEQMLIRYDPCTGDIGKEVDTASINFGGFIEYMDEVFNSVYMQIDSDANANTVKS